MVNLRRKFIWNSLLVLRRKILNILFADFISLYIDHSLFMRFSKSSTLLILIYVDDIIVTRSSKEEIEQIILLLKKYFSLKDLGDLNYFLGIEVKTVSKGLHLSQKKYIEELLKKSKMDNAKPLPTLMISSLKLTSLEGDPIPNALEYRSIVGGLQSITIARLEIAYSVNKLC
ncbi:hypothetical protein UlMin_028159 [Ulmus minor]